KFTYVTVDRAGFLAPCGIIDCNPTPVGALRVLDTTDVILLFDHIVVRGSGSFALDFGRAGTGTLTVSNSQFYRNGATAIRSYGIHDNQLTITGSDLYDYRGQVIQAGFAGIDSVNATGNWWGD